MRSNKMAKPPIAWASFSPTHKLVCWLGLGLGSGLLPKMPGTWGSLAILPLAYALLYLPLSAVLVIVGLISLVGCYICDRTATLLQVHDDGRIVWDEFAGQLLTFLPLYYATALFASLPVGMWLAIGFVWFRLFDVIKPYPISTADAHVHGGIGIMLDDILAGIMAAAALTATAWVVNLLGL